MTDRQIISMVHEYCDHVSYGFSEENWWKAAGMLRTLSPHLDLASYHVLGGLMEEMYAYPSATTVSTIRNKVIRELNNR